MFQENRYDLLHDLLITCKYKGIFFLSMGNKFMIFLNDLCIYSVCCGLKIFKPFCTSIIHYYVRKRIITIILVWFKNFEKKANINKE